MGVDGKRALFSGKAHCGYRESPEGSERVGVLYIGREAMVPNSLSKRRQVMLSDNYMRGVRDPLTRAIGELAALVSRHNASGGVAGGKYSYEDYKHSVIGCVASIADSPALSGWEYDLKGGWTENMDGVMSALKPQASQEQLEELESLYRVLTNALETGANGDPWSFTIRTSGYKLTDAQVDGVVGVATEAERELGLKWRPGLLIEAMYYMAFEVGCGSWMESLEKAGDAADHGKKLTTKQLCDLVKDDVAQFRLFVAQCSTEDQLNRLTAAADVLDACIKKVATKGRKK